MDTDPSARPMLPGYELLEPLGAGAYGTVYLAVQHNTGARVAIKVARLEGDARRAARFHRETGLCSRLHHPHIVRLLDKGQEGPHVYGVFEYIPGETLKSYIRRHGSLSALETGQLMAQVLDALDCAHRAGVVHRDLKPDNVMITRTGAVPQAMVLDFGIGTLVPQARGSQFATLTMTEECLGTPAYCAPEQLRGELPSIKSDLYAWGLMCLECLTGRPAVAGSAAEIFHQQLSLQEMPLPPELAAHPLGALLRRALKKNSAERCGSAGALLRELQQTRLDDLVGRIQPAALGAEPALPRTISTPRGFSEKRQMTVLCCSVCVWPQGGAEPADVERLELAQREEFSMFCDAAARRGGMLAGALGGHMLVLFGYPYACDSDARRAAMTALDLAALAACRHDLLRQSQRMGLAVRIGMHTGVGIVAPGEMPSGQAVNLAMRLEGRAEPGSILVSESSARLLNSFAELAPMDRGTTLHDDPGQRIFELKPRRQETLHAACIGREREFARLLTAWERAGAGHGATVLLRGEPGIGKSCVADGLREQVATAGLRVLRGQCLPEQRNSALAPILPMLRQHFSDASQALAELQSAGCDAARVLPIVCAWLSLPLGPHEPSQVSPALQKALLLSAIGQWLGRLCEASPVLFVIEDLHWVDPTTAELLQQLAAAVPAQRMLLVLTARPAWPLPEGMAAEVLELSRLDDAQAALVARQALAPREADPAVIEHIVARTDGVPLFVQELARMLAETHLVERDGRWTFAGGAQPTSIPATLRDSLIARFDRLGPLRDVLQLAATIGRHFELGLLQACAGAAAASLPEALQSLQALGLVARDDSRPGEAFVFRHALIRDTAYDCMVSSRRRLKHRAVARALMRLQPQRLADEPGLIAHHHAEAGDHAHAVELGIRQLHITQLRSLNDETIAYARQVEKWIDELPAAAQRAARLDVNGYLTQALMNRHGWAHEQVEERIAASRALLDSSVAYEQEVRHLWAMITYHHVASHRAEVRQLSDRLMELAQRRQDESVLVAACTYTGLAHYSDGRFTDAEQMLSEAIERYRPAAHAHHAGELGFDTRVWACSGRALVRWFAGHAGADADAAQAVEWAREIGHVPSLGMALLYQSKGLLARDDRDGVLRTTGELLELAARHGLPAFAGYGGIVRFWAEGDVAQADGTIEALWRMGCRYCQSYYRAYPADTLARQGRWTEALARMDACLQLAYRLDEHMYTAELYLARARCLEGCGAEPGATEAALARAEDAARRAGKFRTLANAGRLRERLLHRQPSDLREGCTT